MRNCRDLTEFGKEIRATVLKRTHLTVGVGIAQTKTLAKLANHAAKKWQRQTGGVVDLSNIDRQRRLLAIVPVEDVWGVGRRISKKLNTMGIKTALDLSEQSTWIIRKHFNVVLERTVRESCAASLVLIWRSLRQQSRKSSAVGHSANALLSMSRCARLSAAMPPVALKNFGVSISTAALSLRS